MLSSQLSKVISFVFCGCLLLASNHAIQAQSEKPKTATYYFELGDASLKLRNYRTALAHYNEAIRLDPFFWDAYFARAMARERLGDLKGSLTDYNIFLEARPTNVEALFSRAVLRYQNGQWAVAREGFLKLLTLPPGETNTVYFQVDKGEEANKIFTTQGDTRCLYFNYLGLIDLKLTKYKTAIQYFDSAVRVEASCADCYLNRGLAFQMARDTSKAISSYKKTIELNPENSLALHNLAVLSGFVGNLKETEKMLGEAIDKNPKLPYSYAERGHVRMKLKNWKGALADFTEALAIDPTDADDWLSRGLVKEKLKDLAGALNDLTEAIKLKDNFEKAWLCRGNVLTNLNRLPEALEDYTLAIHHYPEYGAAYYNRALAYHKLGKQKEACGDLRKAQDLKTKVDSKVFNTICK
jgi:tetratricopeptide (TPR) repeat protein